MAKKLKDPKPEVDAQVPEDTEDEEPQVPLFPEELPPVRMEPEFPVSEIEELRVEPNVTPRFLASVKRAGRILRPVELVKRGDSRWVLKAGRRRITAARKLKLETVPALLYEVDPEQAMNLEHMLSLTENMLRSDNPVQEMMDIEDLVHRGYNERSISKELGIPVSTVQKRLRMSGQLVSGLKSLFVDGKIALSTAERATKLPAHLQEKLAEQYADTGKLTAADVSAVRQVEVEDAMAAVPEKLFGEEIEAEMPERESLPKECRRAEEVATKAFEEEFLPVRLEIDGVEWQAEKVAGRIRIDWRKSESEAG